MKKKLSLALVLAMVMTMMFSTAAWCVGAVPIKVIEITMQTTEGETVQDVLNGITMTGYIWVFSQGAYNWYPVNSNYFSINSDNLSIKKAGETDPLDNSYKLISGEGYTLTLGAKNPGGATTPVEKTDDDKYGGTVKLNGNEVGFTSSVITGEGSQDNPRLFTLTLDFVGTEAAAPASNAPAHVHKFTWQTIYEATPNSDGLEGEVCSCGATRNTQPISAYDYAINKYADQMIKAAKPGQKITLEFGEFNSFPRYMMEKVAARMNENITFVFKFKQNKKMQTVTIEPGTAIDLQYDWYGPDKMKELYGAD